MIKNEEIIERQCIGCGSTYVFHNELLAVSLYCTSSCKKQHSLLNASVLNDINTTRVRGHLHEIY